MSYLPRRGAVYYFRRTVPEPLRAIIGKDQWMQSLGTKDLQEAKRLRTIKLVETDREIEAAEAILAAGAVSKPKAFVPSRAEVEQEEAQAEHDAQAEAEQDALEPVMEAIDAGAVPLASVTEVARAGQLLAQHERQMANIRLEEQANQRMARYVSQATPVDNSACGTDAPASMSIIALFERYATARAADPKTVKRWRSRVADLVAFLRHDDVTRVTRVDLNAWTASLVAKPLAKKTIVDGYIPAISAAFGIAYEDGLIPANPASGLKVLAPKPVQLRDRDLTDDEAATILAATMLPQPPKLAAEHALARRWVPWLCACTGARVGEITQLRACDIQRDGETWLIHITPEAGSVKTGKARKVPLHPHLIEQGFVALAKAGDETPLFYRDGAGNEVNPAYKVRAGDLAKWVRSLGVAGVPQPNHGWRHRFKTLARMHNIPADVADAIQGHVPRHEGGKYGSMPLPVLAEAIGRLPRYLA